MLNLDHYIKLSEEVINSPNLCDRFTKQDLETIGAKVYEGYRQDEDSREPWKRRTQAAMDLAMQLSKPKSFPWPNASNVAFPLLTIAAQQFHARAYPSLVQMPEIVKTRIGNPDPNSELFKRSRRVARHMSFQLLQEDQAWEEQHDRLLLNLPIVGCAFKKTYFSDDLQHNVSELVLAQDLVVGYWAKSIETAQRKTHILSRTHNDIHAKVVRGLYRDVLKEAWYQGPGSSSLQPLVDQARKDARLGITPPSPDETAPFTLLEQHCWLDLDNDGYAEPYIVTIESSSQAVLRIVTRFERESDIERGSKGRIASIRATEYFTKYSFIPSPDGGIYDIGFGTLLGPLNSSVNTLVNQLIDAGTLANVSGGFLGRGAKLRSGDQSFDPFSWNRVDSSGDDLRKNMVPLPVREPSQVSFSLLSLLINYANRVSGATDTLMGVSPGQNTPAETTRSMLEQGQKIYNAIFKRVWRSMKSEFEKLYRLNSYYLPLTGKRFGTMEMISREDYLGNPADVFPVADPNLTSETERVQIATVVKQAASTTPGYNLPAVERQWLTALRVENIDTIYTGKMPQPQPDPKVQVETIRSKDRDRLRRTRLAETIAKMMKDQAKLEAEVELLKAKAEAARASSQTAYSSAIGESIRTQLDLRSTQLDNMRSYLEMLKMAVGEEPSQGQGLGQGTEPMPEESPLESQIPQEQEAPQ